MQTIGTILEEAGRLNAETSVRSENPPFQRLIIEMLAECGPDGHRANSIANYDDNQHTDNENVRIGNIFDGMITLAALMMHEGTGR